MPTRVPIPPTAPSAGQVVQALLDEQGRQYTLDQNGQRIYSRPELFSANGQPSDGGLMHNPDTWNKYTGQWEPGGLNWGAVVPWVGLAAMGGAAGAAAAGGAGAAGTASALGPTTPATMAATSAAVGAGAPAGIAGTGAAMTAAGIGTTFGIPNTDLFKVGTSLYGNWFGAHLQANAADKSAAMMAASQKYSADLLEKANREALAFQERQGRNAFQNNEVARRSNYAADAAMQRRLGFIGEEVGLGPREIPEYIPGVDPGAGMFDTAGVPGAVSSPGAPVATAGAAVPPAPKTKEEAMQLANQIAYGGRNKIVADPIWDKYEQDPDYYFKRMLGWQAGGGDVATAGPYAGAAAGGAAPVTAPRVAANTVGQTPFMNVVPVGMFG